MLVILFFVFFGFGFGFDFGFGFELWFLYKYIFFNIFKISKAFLNFNLKTLVKHHYVSQYVEYLFICPPTV